MKNPCNPTGCLTPEFIDGLQFESRRITSTTHWRIAEWDDDLKSRVKKLPYNPNEGIDPRLNMRISFMGDTNVQYHDPFNSGQQCYDGEVKDCTPCGTRDAKLVGLNPDPLGCDPPRYGFRAGADEFSGAYAEALWETPVVCADRLHQAFQLRAYLDAAKRDLPKEMVVAHCRELLRFVVANGKYNGAIVDGKLIWGAFGFPAPSDSALDLNMLLQHADIMHGNMWNGTVEYNMSRNTLVRALEGYHQARGRELQVSSWNAFSYPNGGTYDFNGVRIKISSIAKLVYYDDNGEMQYLTPRKEREGTSSGVVPEYDPNYTTSCWFECNGKKYEKFELVTFCEQNSLAMRPYAGPNTGIKGVKTDGYMMDVWPVTGSYLECNDLQNKFKFVGRDRHKKEVIKPETFGAILVKYSPLCTEKIEVCCDDGCNDMERDTIHMADGCPPPANTCYDEAQGHDPCQPSPVCRTSEDMCPEDNPGELHTPCHVQVCPPGIAQLCVERRCGKQGVASIDWALQADSAIAATNFVAANGTLTWADDEFGPKCFEVESLADPDQTATLVAKVAFSNPQGAVLADCACTEACVLIPPVCENEAVAACDHKRTDCPKDAADPCDVNPCAAEAAQEAVIAAAVAAA